MSPPPPTHYENMHPLMACNSPLPPPPPPQPSMVPWGKRRAGYPPAPSQRDYRSHLLRAAQKAYPTFFRRCAGTAQPHPPSAFVARDTRPELGPIALRGRPGPPLRLYPHTAGGRVLRTLWIVQESGRFVALHPRDCNTPSPPLLRWRVIAHPPCHRCIRHRTGVSLRLGGRDQLALLTRWWYRLLYHLL
jgi:hypothetical protein